MPWSTLCYGRPEAFENAYRKIVESYALDAIDTAKKGVEPKGDSRIAIEGFLNEVRDCRVESRPSVGVGTDCRLESDKATGFALVHDGQLVHMSVFGSTDLPKKEK